MLVPLFFLVSGLLIAYAQSPPVLGNVPLAVKTPYLHSWTSNQGHQAPKEIWPRLFNQAKTLGWMGMIRVDGQIYQWLGGLISDNSSDTVVSEITPTRTIFTLQAGHIQFNATFFTPIEPNNYTRQSIPFTYIFVDGFTTDDAKPHSIQLYSDITAEWVSHDESTQVEWDIKTPGDMIYHYVKPKNPQSMVDENDSAEDAIGYYATPKRSRLTWQSGIDKDCRANFTQDGKLANFKGTDNRPVNETGDWPVFSFSIDLGSVAPNNQPDSVVWALGLVRDPLVNYATTNPTYENRTGYYWSAYRNIDDVVSDFLGDFKNAKSRGQTFDQSIIKNASAISLQYAGIISLVTRQLFASMDITIPTSERGRTSPSDVKIFMKDISVSTRVNPVEVIYGALPALLYFNPSLAHDLLLPLFEYQSSPSYSNGYASADLGSYYPTTVDHSSPNEELAVEHCGNMLIMAYAHAAKSGDGSLISKYHSLLRKWADYLAQNSLDPYNAKSADGVYYPEVSNLALKGILGVYFMGKIDENIGKSSDTAFKDKGTELIKEWKTRAAMGDHIQSDYGKPGTGGLMYNLFPAVWLERGLIDDDILNREAQFYSNNKPPEDQSYGLNNGQKKGIAYPHWALMTSAIIPTGFTPVRDALIRSTYLQAYNDKQEFPLPVQYNASSRERLHGSTIGSPIHGAAFAILAMSMNNVEINPASLEEDVNAEKKTLVGSIVGGVIGGAAFLFIIAGATFFWRRHKVQQHVIDPLYEEERVEPHPFNTQYAPISDDDGALPLRKRSRHPNIRPSTGNESSERRSGPPGETATPPITPPQPLSSKGRRVLLQNQSHQNQSEIAEPALSGAPSTAGYERGGETWRAEVEELRRQVEAIRDIAQPPPSYR